MSWPDGKRFREPARPPLLSWRMYLRAAISVLLMLAALALFLWPCS